MTSDDEDAPEKRVSRGRRSSQTKIRWPRSSVLAILRMYAGKARRESRRNDAARRIQHASVRLSAAPVVSNAHGGEGCRRQGPNYRRSQMTGGFS